MGNALADPGKYRVYTCSDLQTAALEEQTRATELEQLLARSSQGTGGAVMGAIAYRSEYNQVRARLRTIKASAQNQSCSTSSPHSSGRALY